MNSLDINTMQLLCTTILVVLSVLMILLWNENKNQRAGTWWCAFSILLTIDAVLVCFPELRNMEGYVYYFNIIASFSYFALMFGCLEFAGIKYDKKAIILLFVSCVIINAIGSYIAFPDVARRSIIIGFNTFGLVVSSYAISKLNKHIYYLEKYSLLSLLAIHLSLHIYWVFMELDVSVVGETLFSKSATPIYIILIFIMIALLLLNLGKIRNQLERENLKSRAIEKALSLAVRETNVANKSKSIFLTNMSHELRTPLNIILGFSEALQLQIMGPLNEKQQNFVENIHFGGKRLLFLINDLLSLSNIEAGNLNKEFEKVTPDALLNENFKILKEEGEKHPNIIYFIKDVSDCPHDSYLLVDREWITQILTALIDNTLKYAKKDGNIWVNGFLCDENTVRITIKDEGQGISEDERENVFKPFNRAGADIKAIEGTGAGLAIVKGLVEAMDGSIGFESRKGAGSTFWINLPLFRS